ncbi:MAG: hemolysin family protein [Treponema sp.]|jgi:putative hemolysin|nr:hemolysin family protein [Treponema sp.]
MVFLRKGMIFIAGLIIASGFFALFERAIKTAQKPRMQAQADDAEKRGRIRRANSIRRGMEAVENPDRHLAAARIWISVLRTLAAILAGINLEQLTHGARGAGISFPLSVAAGTAAIALAILLFGDVAPRIIARASPERIAVSLLPLFEAISLSLRPLFFLAKAAGKGLRPMLKTKQPAMTEDELRIALMESEKSGIVESKERTMVEGVFYLGDRSLGAFMTHRSELQWLDINAPPQDIRAKVLEFRAQRCFPVADGTLDAIIGAAYLEDIILDLAQDQPAGLRAVMKKPLFAPETMPALKTFETFRRGETSYIFVMDEYGGFAGMVWLQDLMEEIVGELTAPVNEEKQAVQLEDGSWLIDGSMNTDDAASLLSLPGLADSGEYHTLAGFVLSLAGELPRAGDSFNYCGCRFTVMDMDGNRIDKVQVRRVES